jgi:PA domain
MTTDHFHKPHAVRSSAHTWFQSTWLSQARAGATALSAAAALTLAVGAAQAATIQVVNIDDPGVGFNDPTPAAPVGGNPGTTVGAQRQFVFEAVAKFWGSKLTSDVPIKVLATFTPLECTATGGVLGAATAYNRFVNFPNAKRAGTWYPSALANKLAGVAIIANPDPFESADIISFFNSNLGKPGCLEGASTYFGVDGKAADGQIDLVSTVLHEFGHGLGFQTYTNGQTGQQLTLNGGDPAGFPSVWDHLMFDPKLRKTWDLMSPQERAASALVPRNLVWKGETVTRNARRVLERGTPELFVSGTGLNKFVLIGTAEFGPRIESRSFLSAPFVAVADQADGRGLACTPLDAKNSAAVQGRVALIDRGDCDFTVKVKNAQQAGARAVVIADNVAGTPPADLPGADGSITIPSLRVSQEDGKTIKTAAAASAGRPSVGPYAVLFVNSAKLRGADYFDRVYLYTPNPYSSGSSVSHYDTLARPNLLMEPSLNRNQPFDVTAPNDLTLELFRDIGW